MKERIQRHWERNKWIYLWAGISILFAIIVQCLFSKSASSEIFHAKWGAGDILTYASTVALGLLAVWQNQKFKEENDKAQERLEELTKQANELSIIGRIIDNKSQKLDNLRHAFSDFEAACNVGLSHHFVYLQLRLPLRTQSFLNMRKSFRDCVIYLKLKLREIGELNLQIYLPKFSS